MAEAKSLRDYLNNVVECAGKAGHVFIYGGGVFAKRYFSKLQETGVAIEAFVVTSKDENLREICGKPVIQIDEVNSPNESSLFIIGTKPDYGAEIETIIRNYGYSNIIAPGKEEWFIREIETLRRSVTAIEVTTKIGCSVACRYCPQELLVSRYFSTDKNRKSMLSLEDYKICLEHLPDDTIITFSGFVEPFLNPLCVDMILMTAEHGNKISLHTTLRGLSLEGFERIKYVPFEYICLHLPDKDGYAKIPVTDEYMQVLDRVLDAKKKDGSPWELYSNCQSDPLDEVVKLIDRRMYYTKIHLVDRAGNISDSDINEQIANEGPIFCAKSPDLRRNVLLPDGSLALCCMDFGLDHIIGNLIKKTYEEIRNDETLRMIGSAMNSDEGKVICRRCSIAKRNI